MRKKNFQIMPGIVFFGAKWTSLHTHPPCQVSCLCLLNSLSLLPSFLSTLFFFFYGVFIEMWGVCAVLRGFGWEGPKQMALTDFWHWTITTRCWLCKFLSSFSHTQTHLSNPVKSDAYVCVCVCVCVCTHAWTCMCMFTSVWKLTMNLSFHITNNF